MSYQERQTASINGTLRGGFTATKHGAALHNSTGTTDTARIMVDTNGVGGVPFNHEKRELTGLVFLLCLILSAITASTHVLMSIS